MKTRVVITIEHPDALSADYVSSDVIAPFISDVNSDSNDEWSFTSSPALSEDTLRAKALRTALLLVLSDFPEALTNEWVIDAILNDDERIVVWEALEFLSKEDIVHHIEVTANSIYNTYFQ